MKEFLQNNALLLLLIIGTAFSCVWLVMHRKRLQIPWWVAVVSGVAHTLIGLLAVKVFAVLETFDFSNVGNMSLFGGVFFMPLTYFLFAKIGKRSVAKTFDTFTPCIVFTLLCARVNCLVSGCCYGAFIPNGDGARFPTRETELLFYIILLAYFFIREKKPTFDGALYPVYMISYGIFRFINECFRSGGGETMLHIAHIWAAVALCVGVYAYSALKKKEAKK